MMQQVKKNNFIENQKLLIKLLSYTIKKNVIVEYSELFMMIPLKQN